MFFNCTMKNGGSLFSKKCFLFKTSWRVKLTCKQLLFYHSCYVFVPCFLIKLILTKLHLPKFPFSVSTLDSHLRRKYIRQVQHFQAYIFHLQWKPLCFVIILFKSITFTQVVCHLGTIRRIIWAYSSLYRILHGKCVRTVFAHELLAYQKSNEWAQQMSEISDTKTVSA